MIATPDPRRSPIPAPTSRQRSGRATFLIALCTITAALLWTGCAGYQLGSMLPPDIRTVHVPTFINETDEPLLEVDTTRSAVRTIQRDGSLRLAGEDEADAVLQVRLVDFEITPIAFDRERRAAAEEYRIYITAHVILMRSGTNEVITEVPRVRGENTFLLTGDLTTSKQAGIPGAADDLAQLIISQLVEAWP